MFASIQFNLEFENKHLLARQAGARERVLSLMRTQSSTIRSIYNRLVKEVFKIPSWYVSSALQKATSLKVSQSAWRVLKSALVLPFLGEFFVRDFSPLTPALIQGKWQRRASRLVPSDFGGRSPSMLGE